MTANVESALRAALADVEPGHVGEYLGQHGNTVLATRDKAVLSAAWNWGRQTGVTALPNPCTGVRGKRSKDTHYVPDADLQAVTACGDVVLREALELLYLSGANPKDMLSWRAGIPEHLEFRRAKTAQPVRIRVEGELLQLLERIAERKRREQRITFELTGKPGSYRRRNRREATCRGFPVERRVMQQHTGACK